MSFLDTKSVLENKKFYELKALAREIKLQGTFLNKRDLIDHLLMDEEKLDSIAITLINNSDTNEDSSCSGEIPLRNTRSTRSRTNRKTQPVEESVPSNLISPSESLMDNKSSRSSRKSKSNDSESSSEDTIDNRSLRKSSRKSTKKSKPAQSRFFSKPRITIFQTEENQQPDTKIDFKGESKFFTPYESRKSRSSLRVHNSLVLKASSSKRKSVTPRNEMPAEVRQLRSNQLVLPPLDNSESSPEDTMDNRSLRKSSRKSTKKSKPDHSESSPERTMDNISSRPSRKSTKKSKPMPSRFFSKPRMTIFQTDENQQPDTKIALKREEKFFTPFKIRKSRSSLSVQDSVALEAASSSKRKRSFTPRNEMPAEDRQSTRCKVVLSPLGEMECKNGVSHDSLVLEASSSKRKRSLTSRNEMPAEDGQSTRSKLLSEHIEVVPSPRITRKTRQTSVRFEHVTPVSPSPRATRYSRHTNLMNEANNGSGKASVKQFPISASKVTRRAYVFEEKTTEVILNETFELQDSIPEISEDVTESLQESSQSEEEMKAELVEKMEVSSYTRKLNTSTPNEKSIGKENDSSVIITDVLNTTFDVLDEVSSTVSITSNTSKSKRRSSSCPPQESTKKSVSFFSPTSSTTKSSTLQRKATPKPAAGTKIPRFMKNMPDFKNIHEKEFKKMESLTDNIERKKNRAKTLLTPKVKIISKPAPTVMVFGANPQTSVNQLRAPMIFGAHPQTTVNPARKPMTQKNTPVIPFRRYDPQPAPAIQKPVVRPMQRQDVKAIVMNKLPLHNRRDGVREKERTKIQGVRLNRRFELQMAHRKLN